MLGLLVLAMAGCADRQAPVKQEQDSQNLQPFGKLSRAKVGMTVEQVETIMGHPGQMGTVTGQSGDYLAWDHIGEDGKAVKVWIEVKDGKVSGIGRGGFRPKRSK
jgi:hypothetical protein